MIIFKKQVAADTKYTATNQANCVTFDVHNDTPYNMGVSFGRDTGVDNADYYTGAHSILTGIKPLSNAPAINAVKWQGTIYIYTETPLGTGSTDLSSAPAFQITVIGYPTGYQPQGTTSMSRMTATPNAVNTNVNSTSAILNTGNAPDTNIINVQPSDAASATWTADNSGNLTVKGDNAGTLTTLLQLIAGASPEVLLAASGVLTEVLGMLQVDQTLTASNGINVNTIRDNNVGSTQIALTNTSPEVTISNNFSVHGTSSLDNGAITTNGSGAFIASSVNRVLIDENASNGVQLGISTAGDCLDQTGTDLYLKAKNGGLVVQSPNGTTAWTLRAMNTGTSLSGTINHGLGGTPSSVLCVCDATSSSATVGAYSYTSTQFGMTIGNSFNGRWWAYR